MIQWSIAINLRESVSNIVEKAIVADTGGMDSIWITDYPAVRLSPVLASAVANKTKRCRIGVGLLSPLIYQPNHIVQYISTLIKHHGDRFDLLIGPGDRSKLSEIGVDYGHSSSVVRSLPESLDTIRKGLADYEGCRVFLGAQGLKMVRASRNSDGVLLNYSDPDMIRWAIETLGHTSNPFEIGVFPPTYIGKSVDCIENLSIRTSAAIVALGMSPLMKKKFGLTEALRPAQSLLKEKGNIDESVINLIDQNIIDRFCICETPEGVCKLIQQFRNMGVTLVVFGPPQGATLTGVKKLIQTKSFYESSDTSPQYSM
jgi:alkanesulfonate monooxygenase SsuD/methylene tetrahydromethanopterin reductase-like flavin-dependent oxidoreductase (luciferase family)